MPRPAKARKFGLTRNDHPYASLHPNAKDSRADDAGAEAAVDAPPESSSDEESTLHETTAEPANSVNAAPQGNRKLDTMNAGSPFSALASNRRVRQTYGKYSTKPNAASQMRARYTSKTDESPETSTNETAFSDSTSTAAEDITKLRTSRPNGYGARQSSKNKLVIKGPRSVQKRTTAPPPVSDAQPKRKQFTMPASLISSVTSSPPPSSEPQIQSSCTLTSENVDPADLGIKTFHDEADDCCPVCGAKVDMESLDDLRASLGADHNRRRELVNQQTEFCRRHQEADARQAWSQRGYPDIDWGRLPTRLEQHREALRAILEPTNHSYFRQRLEEKLSAQRHGSKRARETLLQQFEQECDVSEDVGYYGGKGAAICMTFIANTFGVDLQRIGQEDSLIAACGGVASYEQLVLLPELCSLLVVEDQRAAQRDKDRKSSKKKFKMAPKSKPSESELESARAILRESAEIGHLIWDEENEDVGSTDSENEVLLEKR